MIQPTIYFTFQDFLLVYEEGTDKHMGLIRPTEANMKFLRTWAVPMLGNLPLVELRTSHINLMMRKARQSGLTTQQMTRLRRLMWNVCELAFRIGLSEKNMCEDADHWNVRLTEPVIYTREQSRRIQEAVNNQQYSGVFLLICAHGVPLRFISALTLDNFDFDNGILRIEKRADCRKDRIKLYYLPDELCYSIHLSSEMQLCLQRELRIQEQCKLRNGALWSNPDRLIFTGTRGEALRQQALQGQYINLREKSGIPDLSMRTMRSNYLAASLREGGDLRSAIECAGFADVRSIMRYYYAVQKEIGNNQAVDFLNYLECEGADKYERIESS